MRRALLVLLLILTAAPKVAAEPLHPCTPSEPCHLRMRDDTTLTKGDGTTYLLPPGHFYDEPTWDSLDTEVRRLQTQETRLTEENKVLRENLNGWRPGWVLILGVAVASVGAGAGVYYWYEHR